MSDNYVTVDELTAGYAADVPVLENVNLEVARGEFVCILGPSGSGKSTLLATLSGLKPPQRGRILVDGVELYGDRRRSPQTRLGYVFQDSRLLPWRTVAQNISIVLDAAGVPGSDHEKLVREYLTTLKIGDFYDAWPLNLSGGQRQRVAIARAMAIDPQYLLMDEPFSTLDELTARELRQELLRIWRESGKTIIFVTHSIREAVFLADRIFVLTTNPGRLYRTIEVDMTRPRSYEDVGLARLEAEVIDDLLTEWGRKPESVRVSGAP